MGSGGEGRRKRSPFIFYITFILANKKRQEAESKESYGRQKMAPAQMSTPLIPRTCEYYAHIAKGIKVADGIV